MKTLIQILLTIIIFASIFYSNQKQEIKTIEKTVYIEKPIVIKNKKKIKNDKLEDIYLWEYSYLFLYKNYIIKESMVPDYPFKKYLKKLQKQKINDLNEIEKLFKENNISHKTPTVTTKGTIDFKNKNINKAFNLLKKLEEKKQIYKYLCITFNSVIYKYSELIKEEKNEKIKKVYYKLMNENINKLLAINATIKKIGLGDCCKLANILCKIEKKIDYKKFNNILFEEQCREKVKNSVLKDEASKI